MTTNFLLLSIFICVAFSLKGFDMSLQMCNGGAFTPSTFQCFKNNGFGFSVIQSIQGGNGNTKNIVQCLRNAVNAGFAVSLYGWMCPRCNGQANAYQTGYNAIESLKKKGYYFLIMNL
jgi:hypothetical protein